MMKCSPWQWQWRGKKIFHRGKIENKFKINAKHQQSIVNYITVLIVTSSCNCPQISDPINYSANRTALMKRPYRRGNWYLHKLHVTNQSVDRGLWPDLCVFNANINQQRLKHLHNWTIYAFWGSAIDFYFVRSDK